ncbi:hypothetical protein BaRGS_00009712 [Batillaria attramentaria]|uniref:Chitin-binding type-2 domain-containing protein n=1 Tax=Batillaria attramentaria TaxID=370345 RepID=A0ABD0LIB3_9CAEN
MFCSLVVGRLSMQCRRVGLLDRGARLVDKCSDRQDVYGASCLLGSYTNAAFSCSGRTGFYPHPTSCSLFIACVHGQEFHMRCPSGLYYSPTLRLCDWPTTAGCVLPPLSTQDSPTAIQCTASGMCPPHVYYFQFPDWTDCGAYFICRRGNVERITCPDGLFYDFLRWTCAYKQDVTCYNP